MANKKWMQSAVKKPGAFTAWCKANGYGSVTTKCIAAGKASKNTHVVRMATLAGTFNKYSK